MGGQGRGPFVVGSQKRTTKMAVSQSTYRSLDYIVAVRHLTGIGCWAVG